MESLAGRKCRLGGGGGTRSIDIVQRSPKKGGLLDVDAQHCERVEKEIAHRFDVVADGMEKLDNIFSNAAQILEHRVHAITTISRSVTGVFRGVSTTHSAKQVDRATLRIPPLVAELGGTVVMRA